MLTVNIYTSTEGVLTFKDEIEDLTWSMRNAEGLLFNASLPVVMANVVLHTVEPKLLAVKQGDKLVIKNDALEDKLSVSVILVTVLKDKGKTEIACGGVSVGPALLGEGIYPLDSSYLDGSVSGMKVRLPGGTTSNQGHAIIEKREDFLMSYIWGENKLLNLTPAQFLGATGDYDWITFKEDDAVIPIYTVLPDDLISFDTSPAQPPVTALRTIQKVEGKAESVIALPEATYVMPFYLEGPENIQAVYTKKMIKIDDGFGNNIEVMSSQQLHWSDGFVTELDTEADCNVVGVFSDMFLELANTDPVSKISENWLDGFWWDYYEPIFIDGVKYYSWTNTDYGLNGRTITEARNPYSGDWMGFATNDGTKWVKSTSYGVVVDTDAVYLPSADLFLRDKYTGDLMANVTFPMWEVYFDLASAFAQTIAPTIVTTSHNGTEILWFPKTEDKAGSLVLGVRKNLTFVSVSVPVSGTASGTYRFVSAYKSGPSDVNAVFAQEYESYNKRIAYLVVSAGASATTVISADSKVLPLTGDGNPIISATAVDMIDALLAGGVRVLSLVYNSYDGYKMNQYTHIVTIELEGLLIQYGVTELKGHYQYLDSGSTTHTHNTAPMIQIAPLNWHNFVEPLVVINSISDRTVVQSIKPTELTMWGEMAYGYVGFKRYRKSTVCRIGTLDGGIGLPDLQLVALINNYVPWGVRTVGSNYNIYQLNDGIENIVNLPFVSTQLKVLDIPNQEEGRITISIASIKYEIGAISENVSVQDLNVPALMSYINVRTSYDEPVRKMKVIGVNFDYKGVVRMTITGILVDN